MKTVFADSFYFFALLNRNDAEHVQAIDFTKSFVGRIVTTGWVLTEVADGCGHTAGRRSSFLNLLGLIRVNPNIHVEPFSDELFEQGLELFRNRPDKQWSLTDCISFVVMEHEGITEALTGDRDFEQAGWIALFK